MDVTHPDAAHEPVSCAVRAAAHPTAKKNSIHPHWLFVSYPPLTVAVKRPLNPPTGPQSPPPPQKGRAQVFGMTFSDGLECNSPVSTSVSSGQCDRPTSDLAQQHRRGCLSQGPLAGPQGVCRGGSLRIAVDPGVVGHLQRIGPRKWARGEQT